MRRTRDDEKVQESTLSNLLEQLSSNRNVMFIERSLADGLSIARCRGVDYG
jgi:hypothetical protein